MTQTGIPARQAAVSLLNEVLLKNKMIADILESAESPLQKLSPADKARAQSLAVSVLKNLGPLDATIDSFLKKPPPFKVRNILRIVANELIIEKLAPHGVVDSAVHLVRASQKTQHFAGLTNAVSRRLSEKGAEIFGNQAPKRLPNWIAKPVVKSHGKAVLREIETAHARPVPLDITPKQANMTEQLATRLDAEILPTGSLRLFQPGQVSKLPGYAEGDWWIQDAAAALPAQLLGEIDGKDVLDLCAAPGGKTMQLAAAGAKVTALDISAARLKRVDENLKRTKLEATIVEADAKNWTPEANFDAILLDAPCSATGTIRRHPDLPHAKSGDLGGLLRVQQQLLTRAFSWLKPGGKLIYCTCSLLESEGEDQVRTFLATNSNAQLGTFEIPDPQFRVEDGMMRTRPDMWSKQGGIDGFFTALIEKP